MGNDLDLTTPVVDRLLASTNVTDYVADYDPDVGGGPFAGVFSTDLIPGDADFPYVWTAGDVDDTPESVKNTEIRRVLRDIGVYNEVKDGDTAALDQVAEKIRNLFERGNLATHPAGAMTIPGFKIITMETSGPVVAPTDDELMGRIITLILVLQDLS